jgi:hypothetical protein
MMRWQPAFCNGQICEKHHKSQNDALDFKKILLDKRSLVSYDYVKHFLCEQYMLMGYEYVY